MTLENDSNGGESNPLLFNGPVPVRFRLRSASDRILEGANPIPVRLVKLEGRYVDGQGEVQDEPERTLV